MKAVVIGSGIAGLAASVRLRLKGYDVQVFEANDYPGGKLHSVNLGSYRFDGGPSLFTMPQYVDELFALAGKDPRQYFHYIKCGEACRYFWSDGVRINAPSNPNLFAKEVERVLGFPAPKLEAHFEHLKMVFDQSAKIFLEKNLRSVNTWMQLDVVKALLKLSKFDLNKTMHQANSQRLEEPHLVQLFNRFATYNGSSPYQAPGILNVIPWLEHGYGTFFPEGGMKVIPDALFQLAKELGVEFHFSKRVDRIIHANGKARGVEVAEETIHADVVVSNMDVHFTYEKLLKDVRAPKRILEQERSSSALVFYWGVSEKFKELGLHNIFFSADYRQEFESLFKLGEISADPTIYINISSKHEAEDAPENGENWFVMINAPYHNNQDWQEIEQKTRKAVIEKLNGYLQVDLEQLIVEEKIWNPSSIEADTLSYKGALYGNSSNSALAAFLRHPNHSSQVDGLYFCGGSVHPGGGIPLALLSARIMSESIADA